MELVSGAYRRLLRKLLRGGRKRLSRRQSSGFRGEAAEGHGAVREEAAVGEAESEGSELDDRIDIGLRDGDHL